MAEREVKIVITGEDRSKRALKSATKGFQGLNKKIGGFVASAVKALAKVGVAAALGVGAIGVISLKTAIEVESAFAGIIKTTDGLVDEFGVLNKVGEQLRGEFRALAREIPTNLPDLMQVGELGGQLGIASENLVDFTRTVAALGEATNLTREQAATSFAQIANIMGTSQQDFDRMGSSVVELGNNFATTEADIVNFATRIAATGKIAGLAEADVFGIAAAFTSVGIQAEAGGTAVQKVLTAMTKAVAQNTGELVDNSAAILKGQNKLTDLGVSLNIAQLRMGEFTEKTKQSTRVAAQARIDKLTRQINEQSQSLHVLRGEHGKMSDAGGALETFAKVAGLTADEFKVAFEEDAAGAFTAFVEGLGEQGDAAFAILEELELQDQRLVRAFLSLAGAGDVLETAIESSNLAWDENTALTKEAETRYGTMESKLGILKNTVGDVALSIGDVLKGKLEDALDAAMPFITEFAENLPAFLDEKLIPALETIITDIGAVITVVGDFVGDLQADVPFLEAFETALGKLVPAETAGKILEIAGKLNEFITAASTFVTEHAPALEAAFIAIGVAITTASIASAIAGIIAAINPITLVIGAIAVAIGLLAAAWEEDWGGIRGKVADVWAFLEPVFADIRAWLEEKIPPAIAKLTQFWEDKLLPALEAVWKFITAFLLPIWIALVDLGLTIVVKQVEILVQLWENVLLPALQTVWRFIKDNLIPRMNEMGMGWNLLQGAIADVKKFIDKLTGSFGGISNAAEKVVGWINKLKSSIANIKVPKILQPGSASPLENSLRGIAGALIDVTGAFIEFTRGIDKAESTTFKNVGKGINKLTGALRNLAEVSVLLGQAGGAGVAPNIGQFLELFETLLIPAISAIDELVERFGEKTIKKLRKSAKRMRELIDAVMIDMSAIALADLPDMGKWRDQIVALARAVIEALFQLEFEFTAKGLELAAGWAKSVGAILGLVKPGIDALKAMLKFVPIQNLPELAAIFATQLLDVVDQFMEARDDYVIVFEEGAVAWWNAVKSIIGIIKPGVDALAALLKFVPIENLAELAALFVTQLLDVVDQFAEAKDSYVIVFAEDAKEWWANVKASIGIIKSGVEALKAILEFVPIENLPELAALFATQLLDVVDQFSEAKDSYVIVFEEDAKAWWEAVKNVVSVIKPGVDALKAILEFVPVANLPELAALFATQLLDVVDQFSETKDSYVIVFSEAAKAWWDSVKASISVIEPGIKGLKALLEWDEALSAPVAARAFARALFDVVTELEDVASEYDVTFTDEALKFFDAVKKAISIIAPGVKALEKLGEFVAVKNLLTQMDIFKGQMKLVIDKMIELAGNYETEGLEAVQKFGIAVEEIFKGVKVALEALKKMLKLPETGEVGLAEAADFFEDIMTEMVTRLGLIAVDMETTGLAQAQKFADAAVRIRTAILAGINSILVLGEAGLPGLGNIPIAVGSMVDQIIAVIRSKLTEFFNIGFAMGRSLAQGIILGMQSGLANIAGALPVVGAQHGFSGVVTRPTLFLAGEAGPESVNITPGGASGGIHIENLNVSGTGNAGADVRNTIRMLEFGTVAV